MTYEQQIQKLIKDKEPFKGKDGNYKLHTSIEDIFALYQFDDSLRTLLFRYILKIEKHVKSLMSYSFCETNGEDQQYYLNATKYDYSVDSQEDINELITRLTKITNDPKNYPYIRHQKKKYGNIPLWVLIKALTLGTVSKMYSFWPQNIQCKVSKEFEYVNESMLVRMLDLLARVRNVCAHNERLYDYRYRKGTIDDTHIHKCLKIEKNGHQYKKGKNDLFAVIIVLKYLLNDSEFRQMSNELEKIIEELLKNTRMIQKNQLYKYMGFPQNWLEIQNIDKIA